uniref:Uncharacterized protein n=1 Tax=Cannabis sativa TaxID=3483 RepID=A0A803PZA6_CANSA
MAKTRAKIQGKQNSMAKNTRKMKKKGPTSTADVRKTKQIEEVLEVEPMVFLEDEDDIQEDLFRPPLSPRSSLHQIKLREEIQADFDYFLSTNRRCAASIAQGNSNTPPPVLRSSNVVRNLENSFKNEQVAKANILLNNFFLIELKLDLR